MYGHKTRYGSISQDILDRIWEHIKVEDNCWIWTGYTNQAGYPRINVNRRMCLVHVLLYEMENGQVKLDIGHIHCYNRLCVSPVHKTLQTRSENKLDKDVKTTGSSVLYKCGHPRTPENTHSGGNCAVCARTRRMEHYWRNK